MIKDLVPCGLWSPLHPSMTHYLLPSICSIESAVQNTENVVWCPYSKCSWESVMWRELKKKNNQKCLGNDLKVGACVCVKIQISSWNAITTLQACSSCDPLRWMQPTRHIWRTSGALLTPITADCMELSKQQHLRGLTHLSGPNTVSCWAWLKVPFTLGWIGQQSLWFSG